jgi:predicted Zn-dependent protease
VVKIKIALISCTKLKKDSPCEAKDMYLPSNLFSKAVKYIKQQDYDEWFILSAKYGLLDKSRTIETYNITLNNMRAKEIIDWSKEVNYKLSLLNIKQVDFYAGERYRKYLIPLLDERGIKCNVPLKGLGIGQQMQFYNQHSKESG